MKIYQKGNEDGMSELAVALTLFEDNVTGVPHCLYLCEPITGAR